MFYHVNYAMKDLWSRNRGVGKITLLLSAHFRLLFIAIKQKKAETKALMPIFIKLTYNNAYCNSNANGNYGINV